MESENRMQFKRALAFPFQDAGWFKKVLIPAIAQCIPLIGIILATGWALEICRRVIRKDPRELPALEFRRDLAGGLSVWGLLLIFTIPMLLWLGLGGAISAAAWPAENGNNAARFDVFWWGVEIGALAIALGSAMGALAAVGRLAESGSFRSALQIRDGMAALRSAPVAYLLAALAWLPLGFLAVSGIALCGVGVFFLSAYALGSGFHLAGQAHALAASRRLPSAVPPAV